MQTTPVLLTVKLNTKDKSTGGKLLVKLPQEALLKLTHTHPNDLVGRVKADMKPAIWLATLGSMATGLDLVRCDGPQPGAVLAEVKLAGPVGFRKGARVKGAEPGDLYATVAFPSDDVKMMHVPNINSLKVEAATEGALQRLILPPLNKGMLVEYMAAQNKAEMPPAKVPSSRAGLAPTRISRKGADSEGKRMGAFTQVLRDKLCRSKSDDDLGHVEAIGRRGNKYTTAAGGKKVDLWQSIIAIIREHRDWTHGDSLPLGEAAPPPVKVEPPKVITAVTHPAGRDTAKARLVEAHAMFNAALGGHSGPS